MISESNPKCNMETGLLNGIITFFIIKEYVANKNNRGGMEHLIHIPKNDNGPVLCYDILIVGRWGI